MPNSPLITLAFLTLFAAGGCAGHTKTHTSLQVSTLTGAGQSAHLTHSVFAKPKDRDNLKEEDIARVLDAPVEVELPARAGLVVLDAPFSRAAYAHLEPGDRSPQLLARSIEKSKHFKLVSDISPHLADGQHVEGLRELAARYRLKYLVVLTRKFADRSHVNNYGWAWLSVVGIPFAPAYTVRTEGLFEASLMDVRTGTFLFTSQVHAQAWRRETPFKADRARDQLQRSASLKAVKLLAKQFMRRCDRLAKESAEEAHTGAIAGLSSGAP